MGCVNIKSKEFRNLAAKNNTDSNTLELITHKYWIEKGSEELFPTDFYIQAQLGNAQYKEPGKSVRELWKTNYSTPKVFSTMEELQAAQQEALRFFPSSALVHYKNAEGKYVLNVKQPVTRINNSVSEFSENGITRNKIDLGINPKKTYTIDKVQELFNKFNTDRRSKKLAERVFSIAKDLGLKITFDESLPLKSLGRYTDNNTIIYKKSFLERDLMNDVKAPVLLHEVIHALTMYALSDKTKGLGKTKEIENFNKEIDSIYQEVKNNKALKGELGTKDLKEFVAELSNPISRKKLQSIDRKNTWQRILDAFRRLFGIKTDSTYYERAITALDNALSAFDLDLYLRYNGARDLLQKGYKAEEWKFREMPISEVKETIKQYYLNTLPLNLELSEGTKQRLKAAQAAAKIARDSFTYAQENDDTGEAQDKAINSRVDAFNQQYGDLIKTITPFSNSYDGKSFSVKFKTPRELINQQNAPVLEQLNLIDTMSDDDLLSTLALIEQEYADYELINGEEEKPTGKSEHSGPQPFTFNDGITVNAPFKPNKQQAEALNIMSDFINSDETTMTLSGYAGTGKTSLMEMIAQKMRKERKRIVFSATTNKAAAVLKSKVGRAGFDAYTLNKVFGISVEVDSSQAYNARNLVNKIKESDIVFPGNIVVIDEASMINEENYRILNQIAEENNLKVIYVGDEAQLAPVNERQISKVFRNNEGRIARLTQVERTDDNAILKEATDIRNGKPLSGISSFNDKGEGVAYIPPTNRKGIGDIVRHFVQGLKDNPNYFRILAYTNAAISRYNEAVRRTLGYTGYIPEIGEPMTGYNNWGYDRDTRSYRFINSESYKVIDIGKPSKATIRIDNKNISMESVPITLEDSFGNRDTFNLMDIKGNQENLKIAQRLAQEKVRLWEQFRKAPRELKGEIINRINRIEQFLFVNDNIYDPTRKDKNGNPIVLQNKVIDFGYALTIHKSQGSTFTHVLMDDADVSKASGAVNSMQNAIPVGLEADARDFTNTEVKSTEEVDLGDLSNVEEASVQTGQIANVRQQLRYVGVSRATDTVTIISDNVKKEDSPLNHLQGKEKEVPLQNKVNEESNLISATIAPYFNTSYADYVAMTPEKQNEMRSAFADAARTVAKMLDIPLDMKKASFNIGGYEFDNGGSVVEPSFTFRLNTTPEKARLFAALMGDLGFEQQEAVVSNYDVEDADSADGIRFSLEFKDSDALLELIDKFEIKNFTYDKTKGILSVLSFDNADVEKFHKLVNELKEHGYDKESEKFYFKSSYDGQASRRTLYEEWLKAQEGQPEGNRTELYNLVQEALNKLQNTQEQSLTVSSEEIQSPPIHEEKKEVQQNLNEYEKLTQQINNLLDSEVITASEIRHTAELVINSISDTISDIQKGLLNPEVEFPGFSSDLDMKTATRKEIVEAVGINRLIDRAKERFDPENNTAIEDLSALEQADLIVDNWDAIMTLAADVFAANEGFGIQRDYDKGNFKTSETFNVDWDNFNQSQDTETTEEIEGDEQEHWQIESRTLDILNSMSQLVRLGLHECYLLDKDGNKVMSKWGIAERVNPRNAVNSILRWTKGALSLEDMVKKLHDKQTQNPWINQLIERLSDQSGKETDFQSQFFGVFSKHFQPYSIVLLEDGKYSSIPVNNHPALTEAMTSITSQYKIGQHPLFTDRGINEKLLGSENTTSSDAEFNLHKALRNLQTIVDSLNHNEELTAEQAKEAKSNILGVSRLMGYNVSEELIDNITNDENIKKMTSSLFFMVKSLDSALAQQKRNASNPNAGTYNPFAFGTDNNIGGTLRNFLTPITDQLEDTAINAFYDSGKMYQSYVTPSFLTKLMNKFRLEGQEFEDFMMSEYGNSEWFKTAGTDFNAGWRNEWLRLLARDENARKAFDHKVELNFNKHNYMRNMSDAEYTLSLITEYFAEAGQKGQTMVPAWFRVPMQSNKPSSEFIKFLSYRGAEYKNQIVDGLHKMFAQELSRIQTTRMRNHSKNDAEFIKNFDSNGRRFNFLPFLNKYLEANETSHLGLLLKKKIDGLEALSAEEEAALASMVDKAIYDHMEDRVQEILNKWENNGILEAAKNIKDIGEDEATIRANVENFLWNDNFAAKNILQLTITDIAFYKDAEDLQKRLAQLHAPGIRGNKNATDYEGHKVSDGYYRTFILKDFDTFRANIIANINEVFDRKISRAPESQKEALRALKDSLTRPPKTNGENDKGGKYWNINVADAQGYSSPSSYRKKAFIFGRWSKKAEDIYNKLLKGDYRFDDLETAFQPLKPFVYSHLQKNMGVEGAPITTMNVPFQAKNSEYLLIMADAMIRGEESTGGALSRPNLLRAVYRVMQESERLNPTKGIDTVQFESAIKSGLQGRLDISQFAEMPGGEEAAYTYMMNSIFKEANDGNGNRIYKDYNTDTFVHEAPYDDYCMQQEVPAHFKDHEQAHGSQIRMIIPSDLDIYKDYNGDRESEDNKVYYEWTEPDGTKKKVNANEFKREYEETIAANIAQSIDELATELRINSEDKKERNIALSKILQREILSSPRYGVDLIQACSIDKETGEFRIPKGDPIQAKRIEQLINSIIKNRVNKQKIPGGPIVQVSNFGTSRQLKIRFNARSGGLLKLESEFQPTDKYKTYDAYKKAEQAGIAYFEVFAPIWDNSLVEKFGNPDGSINIEAIEATDPELLKMVSYRIPTEDKYSCAPMKVVGFMPREAGEAIMLPYELTEIDDSDFDVDKRYVMRKDIRIVENRSAIEKLLIQRVSDSYASAHNGTVNEKFVTDQVRMYMDNPEIMKTADRLMASIHREKEIIMGQYKDKVYKTIKPTSGKTYRDNKIVDMTLAVLTNEMTADKILNPGGFDGPKKMGYMVAAHKNPANANISWDKLKTMSIDELKDLSYTDKDLTWADTQVQFYRQNSAAASLIGVFAVNKVAHATLESNGIMIAVDELCGETPFTIAGTTFGGRMFIDSTLDSKGNFIGKTLGSLVSASADAVKDPVLNLMNINMTTAGMLNTMLRLGMSFDDAALFLSQDVIERVLNEFNKENLTNYETLSNIVQKKLDEIRKENNIEDDSTINKEELTEEELVKGLTSDEHTVIDYKVLLAFQKLKALTDAMKKPTFATRFNSISSAVGPLIVDNLMIEHKMEQFMDSNLENGTHFYTEDGVTVDIDDIFYDHPILKQFARTVDIAKNMFYDMPAGSIGFRNVLNTLPDGLADKFYNDKKLLDQLSNFYQSYLLLASRFIDESTLKNYVDGFPQWFMKQEYKEKYSDNALINAIRMGVSKKTNRAYLTINITGADAQAKEELSNAWIDLHKADPELSKRLFIYNFFRAGVGFSPKTFMSLVPTYVKERLNADYNGQKISYVDTYRNFPSVNPSIVIDQFIRNNWDNNKLVPKKDIKSLKYHVDLKKGILTVTDQFGNGDTASLDGVFYMKTRINGQTYLWRLLSNDERSMVYTRVMPLGSNGEYIEMSLSNIVTSLTNTTQTVEDMDSKDTSDIKEDAPVETDASEDTAKTPISNTETIKNLAWFADGIMKQRESVGKPVNKTEAENMLEKMKNNPSVFGEYFTRVFSQLGITLNKEDAVKEFKKLC